MARSIRRVSVLLLGIGCTGSALADPPRLARGGTNPTASHVATAPLTGKERLGPKWTDEQRIDNCNVPVDKRGTRPRPVLCPDQLTH
jgi:hypothetical protein